MTVDWITNTLPANDLFNIIRGNLQPAIPNVFGVLQSFNTQRYVPSDEVVHDPYWVNIWLQYPNEQIRELTYEIVEPGDSDDTKMEKIQRWVVENIQYMEDEEQYGYPELWVPPVMLLKTMKGDCEDGAFLIMSLALNAGVDPNRLRFYGGEVLAGEGSRTGGHGWVAYRRESDNEWVPIDFSYYPNLGPMDERTPMKEDDRYVDQYFMFEVDKIITSDINRVRNPEVYSNKGYIQSNILLPGTWLSQYV